MLVDVCEGILYFIKILERILKYVYFRRPSSRVNTGSPSSKYVVCATACVYRELYGKIADREKIV